MTNCDELECDLVEVTAHLGARPSHEAWQGKIYKLHGSTDKYPNFYEVCRYGEVDGICGVNCRHSFYPYFEGQEKHYTQDDLDELSAQKVSYNGEAISRYEGEQKLRHIERNIRFYKKKAAIDEAAGLDNTKARLKIGEWQARARDFTKQTGIARDSAREYVGTSGKQPTGLKPLAKPPIETTTSGAMSATKTADFKFSYGNADTVEKAKQELSNFANNAYIPKDTDIASVNIVTKEFEYLNSKYPVNKLESITFSGRMKPNDGAYACYESLTINKNIKAFGQSVLQPNEWTTRLTIKLDTWKHQKEIGESLLKATTNPEMIKDIKTKLRTVEKEIKKHEDLLKYKRGNVCYKGREIESTITHEYGHIIADQRTGQINGRWANSAFERIDGNALYEKVKMIDNVYNQALANGDIYKISKYAAKNSHEFFAETFAMYAMQEEPLPSYIITMIEEVIK